MSFIICDRACLLTVHGVTHQLLVSLRGKDRFQEHQQTAIISLYSFKRLVFITEPVCVYFAVRIERLNVIQVDIALQSAKSDVLLYMHKVT